MPIYIMRYWCGGLISATDTAGICITMEWGFMRGRYFIVTLYLGIYGVSNV